MTKPGDGVPARNIRVDRRHEAAAIEEGGHAATAVADLLARFQQTDTQPPPAAAGGDRPWTLETLASAIASKAARFLRGAELGAETDFFEAGATSVDAVELVAVLDRELNVGLSLDDVFADGRPRRLAQRWLRAAGLPTDTVAPPASPATALVVAGPGPASALVPSDEPDEDLALITADLALADRLPWCGDPEPVPPRRILLTGATGFLGSHMLFDLLRHSATQVVCLVRAPDAEAGERRLADALTSFSLPWSAEVKRRITVLVGDAGQPHLGLSDEQWHELTQDVDSIVNVAAAVDFLRGYPSLRRANVLGPLTLAELAMTGRPKPLHHISSIAVFNQLGIASIGEDDPVAHVDRLAAGYDRTKWAAEAVLRRARERGLTATFLRPGGIVGHTRTGAYNGHDISSGLMAVFSRYRTAPAARYFNVAPVDWVSRIATAVVCEPSAWGQNYHLTGRANTLTEMVRDMQVGGLNVQVLSWEDWREDFLARMAADPVPDLEFLARVLRNPAARKLCEATLTSPAAAGERTEAFIARHKLPPPTCYDAKAQLKNYERMARDGLVILPGRQDPAYLWFPETMRGRLGPVDGTPDTRCDFALTLWIASMYQLVEHRTIYVNGTVTCARLHPEPLTVEHGEIWVRPDEGVPLRHGTDHPLLRYRLALRDRDGKAWWLEGWKTARARTDYWKQARTLALELGREGEPASLTGVMKVPSKSYRREQIDGIQVNPNLSVQEQRTAKFTWLSWFGKQMVQGLLEPTLRAGGDLLDLRRDAVDRDKERFQAKLKKLDKDRERLQ